MIAVMTIYVVPRFMGFFTELDADLPMITQIVLGISTFMSHNWVLMLIGLVGAVFALRSWGRTEPGRLALDRLEAAHARSWGRCCTASRCRNSAGRWRRCSPAASRWCRRSRSASPRWATPTCAARSRRRSRWCARASPSTSALETSEIFTDMSIDMVKVGEATGSLDEMLNSVSDFLDEQIETRMQRLLSLIEPLMLVFMGIIIAILLISIYLPMYSMLGSSKL